MVQKAGSEESGPTQEMVPTGVSPWLWLRLPQTILGISITVPHMAIVSSRKNQTLGRSPCFGESSRKNTGTREDCLFSCVCCHTHGPGSKASYVREKIKDNNTLGSCSRI